MAYSSPSASSSRLGPTLTKPTISPSRCATSGGQRRCISALSAIESPASASPEKMWVYAACQVATCTAATSSASAGVPGRITAPEPSATLRPRHVPLDRRDLLVRTGLLLATGGFDDVLREPEAEAATTPSWKTVRAQFRLEPGWIQLGGVFLG